MSRVPQAKSQAIMTVNRLNSLHSDQENSSHTVLLFQPWDRIPASS